MLSKARNEKGFSLVELMVVVAIIGILAAIAVPNFQKFTSKAKQAEAKSNLSAMYSSLRAYHSEFTLFRCNFGRNGYAPTGDVRYRHGFAAENGTAFGTSEPALNPTLNGLTTAAYCPLTAAGTVSFCREAPAKAYVAPPASVCGNDAFTAYAIAFLHGSAVNQDAWTIDQSKMMRNPVNGVE